eukprot:13046648-Ditylum_brightwellii.AAC.1
MDESVFQVGADWKRFYGEFKEELPDNMPTQLGREIKLTSYVDLTHAVGNLHEMAPKVKKVQ